MQQPRVLHSALVHWYQLNIKLVEPFEYQIFFFTLFKTIESRLYLAALNQKLNTKIWIIADAFDLFVISFWSWIQTSHNHTKEKNLSIYRDSANEVIANYLFVWYAQIRWSEIPPKACKKTMTKGSFIAFFSLPHETNTCFLLSSPTYTHESNSIERICFHLMDSSDGFNYVVIAKNDVCCRHGTNVK